LGARVALGDHKKVGKRFVTPLNELGIQGVSYYRELFPELLWMGFVRERAIQRDAAAIILELAKSADELWLAGGKPPLNFSFCSSYSRLDDSTKENLKSALSPDNLLRLQDSLAPLNLIYLNYPMAFLGPPREPEDRDVLLSEIKRVIRKYANKYEQPGLFLQATAFYIRVSLGRVSSHAELPDINKIFTDPESDEGKIAASSVRAAIMAESAMRGTPEPNWPKEFWNQGAKIDKCEF
jgi:hypothetical protein